MTADTPDMNTPRDGLNLDSILAEANLGEYCGIEWVHEAMRSAIAADREARATGDPAEREAFGRWCVTVGWVEAPTARENGTYVNGQLQARWLGWQARAALSDRSTGAVPAGWDIKRAEKGIIVTGPVGGCVVWADEEQARVIPGEILYALADSLLAATGAAGEPKPAEHVGDTLFEGWLSCHEPDRTDGRRCAYTKQDMRTSYWAGYSERSTLGDKP